jgi:hypothetical protein
MFEEERTFLQRVEQPDDPSNSRDIPSDSEIESIRNNYPEIPDDYLAYLREIGWGCARESQYIIHQGLSWCHDDSSFNWFNSRGRKFLVFGSNSMGDLWAFDAEHRFKVCELLHGSRHTVLPFEGSFKAFIRQSMLLSPDGRDERAS